VHPPASTCSLLLLRSRPLRQRAAHSSLVIELDERTAAAMITI